MWEMPRDAGARVHVGLLNAKMEDLVRAYADHHFETNGHTTEAELKVWEEEANFLGPETVANTLRDVALEQGDEEIGGGGFYVGRHYFDYATEDEILSCPYYG